MGIRGGAQGVESGKDLILIKIKKKTSTKKILQTNYWGDTGGLMWPQGWNKPVLSAWSKGEHWLSEEKPDTRSTHPLI